MCVCVLIATLQDVWRRVFVLILCMKETCSACAAKLYAITKLELSAGWPNHHSLEKILPDRLLPVSEYWLFLCMTFGFPKLFSSKKSCHDSFINIDIDMYSIFLHVILKKYIFLIIKKRGKKLVPNTKIRKSFISQSHMYHYLSRILTGPAA